MPISFIKPNVFPVLSKKDTKKKLFYCLASNQLVNLQLTLKHCADFKNLIDHTINTIDAITAKTKALVKFRYSESLETFLKNVMKKL